MELISLVSQNQRGISGRMLPFSFPPTKFALWNPASVGESILSHLNCYRNPKLLMSEKTLRLAHRHAKQSRRKPFTCFLIGTLVVDEDGKGISLTIDRFDPGREVIGGLGKVPSAPLPGDFLIPCTINAWGSSSDDVIVHNSEDFSLTFKILQENLNSQDSLDPSKLLTLRVYISSTENMDNLNFDFHWAAVTVANPLKYTPVKSVPIIPTALARNLSSNMSIAQVQGTYKCGYLTMDQTRKLLLVLESDPKVSNLPLIGIWLSGISHISSPQVWACCLHYLFNSSIQERVFSESGSFLIVLYSLIHKDPEFYECLLCSGRTELGFQLLTSKETLHLFQDVDPSDKYPIQFELSSENKNAEMEFFSKISKNISLQSQSQVSSPGKLSVSDHDSGVEDDASPRPFPHPHPVSQKVTEIQPSVPELSIVFDSKFKESVPTSKHVMTVDKNFFPSPIFHTMGPIGQPPHQIQSSDVGRQTFDSHSTEPSPRQFSNQLKQRNPALKPCKGMRSPAQPQPNCISAGSQSRKSFGSSSPSTPCSESSPNTSAHQLGAHSEKHLTVNDAVQRKGELPLNEPDFKQRPLTPQPPWPNSGFSSPNLRKPVELQIPVQGPPCCLPCVCSCPLHSHIQYSPNIWQGMCKMSSSQTPEIQSNLSQESTQLMFHQNIECTNSGCNQVYTTSSPINLGHYGIMGNCSPLGDNVSPTIRVSSSTDPGNAQSHAVCSACVHTPPPKMGLENGMMGLSPDIYRILTQQDRQLKMLQAQIQRLLEAQSLQSCSTKSITNSGIQSEKQLEFVAMETQSSPGLHMKKSVSIAVSTGASLFWNAPLENSKESAKQDDVEISNEDINISMNTEKNRSQTSIASSLKAVDIPSFVDSIHVIEVEPGQLCAGNCRQITTELAPTSVLGESVSMCLQTRPSEGPVGHLVASNEQHVDSVLSAPPDDRKFYQDILGQVNHFLKESSEESSYCTKEDLISNECASSSKVIKTKQRNSVPSLGLRDEDSVLSATLNQLRNLGVNFDSSGKMNNAHKVENASILACINPEAVVPGLNYISFANVGMSGITPNVADLSMEANAIALKYLSESQLSQLSLSRSSQKSSMDSSIQTLLHSNTDKSLVGFGLISPSNMSFATKKYMKRYGLLQNSDGSGDDEEEQQTDSHRKGEGLEPVLQLNLNPTLDGFTCRKGPSERTSEGQLSGNLVQCETKLSRDHILNSEDALLRNVTNAILPLKILQPSNESSHPFLKDSQAKIKLLPGKSEFTQHADKENLDVRIVPEAPIFDHLNQTDNINSVGTFLDVHQLRQLPKLF
ncbi:SCL-interrupting locus protein [Tiliqua scincoides]|uniref:SCL-interrupting locus protein n=1 Tax=Tiliqua scincoides TaxID=71010 RepID=UPI003462D18F